MVDTETLLADLAAEHEALDRRVEHLDGPAWHTPTPAAGWDVADQISHLCYFDGTARLALTDPDAFAETIAQVRDTPRGDGRTTADVALARRDEPAALLEQWRRGRAGLIEALGAADPSDRVPWYGPRMSPASFATARLMETWAHGQDVADALHLPPVVSDRLRHVCHLGIGARAYSFLVHEVADPGDPIRVEAAAPGGGTWTWGPDGTEDLVRGPAVELALLLTQRRHRDDLDIEVRGSTAEAWVAVAQAFAGPAGPGRPPSRGRSRP